MCIIIVTALLLLSVTVKGQSFTDWELRDLFEEALVNSSESLYKLQRIYFNPSTTYSPVSVHIKVSVTVDNINIQNGQEPYECYGSYGYATFLCEKPFNLWPNCTSGWYFTSSYKLKLAEVEGGTSQLSDLLTWGSTEVFNTFDPSFFTIMQKLTGSDINFGYSIPIDNVHKST